MSDNNAWTDSQTGRLFQAELAEIGQWLRQHPKEVLVIEIERPIYDDPMDQESWVTWEWEEACDPHPDTPTSGFHGLMKVVTTTLSDLMYSEMVDPLSKPIVALGGKVVVMVEGSVVVPDADSYYWNMFNLRSEEVLFFSQKTNISLSLSFSLCCFF